MIIAHNIFKSFGDTSVLSGLDLNIKRGGIYGLAGRSGAGKSTTLRCINGLEGYDSGSLVVDGVDVKTLSRKDMMAFRKNIGMIFQHFSLLERLTVYDNVALPLRCWKYKASFIDTKVRELLEIVGIPEKIKQKPRELSGGQKQRVAIARALTMDPHILLCDEATSALDPKTSQSIIGLLKEINRQMGITIVCVTHQMSVLRGLCKGIAILENGKVAASGTVEEIFRHRPLALQNLIGEDVDMSAEKSAKRVALLLPDTVTGLFISCMAKDLGIDLTIQGGNPGCSGETVQGLAISFPENSYDDVERYLVGHDVVWKDLNRNNSRSEPVETYKEEHQAQMSAIQN
jgi:D-methionine transport system ATP-binding protein